MLGLLILAGLIVASFVVVLFGGPDLLALGLGYMTQQGYLAVGRAAEILGSA